MSVSEETLKKFECEQDVFDALKCGTLTNEEALEVLNDYIVAEKQYVLTCDNNSLIYKDNAYFDELLNLYFEDGAIVDFVTMSGGRKMTLQVHESTAENKGFYCSATDRWFDNSHFEEVCVDGDYVCLQENEHRMYYWEQDEEYHWEPEDEYDDEDSEYDIPDYHSIHRPYDKWNNTVGYGVELEIFSPSRQVLNENLPKGIFGERDGSLDPENGIELVGKPYEFAEYILDTTPWKTAIDLALKLDSKSGRENHRRNYGMHVSASRKLFPNDLLAAKFIVFFNMQEHLCKMLAQRDVIYSGNYKVRKKLKDCFCYENIWGDFVKSKPNHNSKLILATDKYEAVKTGTNRLEVRIFRSTLDYSSFLKNIEFVEAVKCWTSEKTTKTADVSRVNGGRKYSCGTKLFLEWLSSQPGFHNLKKFIARKAKEFNHINGIDLIKV